MHILRGIRMMMVRLITCATRHHELRATCFPRGGVPTTSWQGGVALQTHANIFTGLDPFLPLALTTYPAWNMGIGENMNAFHFKFVSPCHYYIYMDMSRIGNVLFLHFFIFLSQNGLEIKSIFKPFKQIIFYF